MINLTDILNSKILIVDDQASNVELLENFLRDAGYRSVFSTNKPEDVSALHEKNAYDLILLDIMMPGVDGFQVMEDLKNNVSNDYIPVIVLTAEPGHKLRALEAGAKDFISKPFDLIEAKTRIHNMLEVRLLYKRIENYNLFLEQAVQERTAQLRESEARFRSLTELASDWYWEQNAAGEFTTVHGPVFNTLGLDIAAFLGNSAGSEDPGWNETERQILQAKIAAREPFLDLAFNRVNADGSAQQFRVSGEPIFDQSFRFIGYRGIGVETTPTK